jgi:hypothetical protein
MSETIEKGKARPTHNAAAIRAADRAALIWQADTTGPIVVGSEAHKQAFCRMLLETHNPYRPSIVDWPALEPAARDRLVCLPIWDVAMQTEGNASLRVLSYAETIADPLLRQAVEIDGFEETRHKQVLSNLVAAYGIPAGRLLRMRRYFLRLRAIRACQAFGIFSPRTRRHLRAGGAGGGPAHSFLCELGGLAPAQSTAMAARSLCGKNSFRMGFPDLGADRDRPRH